MIEYIVGQQSKFYHIAHFRNNVNIATLLCGAALNLKYNIHRYSEVPGAPTITSVAPKDKALCKACLALLNQTDHRGKW